MKIKTFRSIGRRPARSHKGDFGRVLILAGSKGYAGAAHLAGVGALRSGAGLVTLGVPEKVYGILARRETEVMVRAFPSSRGGAMSSAAVKPVLDFARSQHVVAAGPGLSGASGVRKLIEALLKKWKGPLVLDADALNVLQGRIKLLKDRDFPAVLTPHEGEFSRLFGAVPLRGTEGRRSAAKKAARVTGCVIVLKGHHTVIADPSGQTAINRTGNPGMATAGSGDVLTGVIAALLAQGLSSFEAARRGAYVHGLAGDLAAETKGQISLIAGDIAEALPEAFQYIFGKSAKRKKNGKFRY